MAVTASTMYSSRLCLSQLLLSFVSHTATVYQVGMSILSSDPWALHLSSRWAWVDGDSMQWKGNGSRSHNLWSGLSRFSTLGKKATLPANHLFLELWIGCFLYIACFLDLMKSELALSANNSGSCADQRRANNRQSPLCGAVSHGRLEGLKPKVGRPACS